MKTPPKKLVRDCLLFFVLLLVVHFILDLSRDLPLNGPYFLNLLGKVAFIAVTWGIVMGLFNKSYRETGEE